MVRNVLDEFANDSLDHSESRFLLRALGALLLRESKELLDPTAEAEARRVATELAPRLLADRDDDARASDRESAARKRATTIA